MVPLLVALLYGENDCAVSFLVSIVLCALPGIIIYSRNSTGFQEGRLKARYSYLIVTSSWIIASVAGALPYVISGSIPDFAEAFFETCSGFSTTGSTILQEIESLPKSILFWRCATQWLGGMGIIVLFVALLPNFGIKAQNIAGAETPGPISSTPTFSPDTA